MEQVIKQILALHKQLIKVTEENIKITTNLIQLLEQKGIINHEEVMGKCTHTKEDVK